MKPASENPSTRFSNDRRYRWTLLRDWSDELRAGRHFTFDPHPDYYPGKPDTFIQFIGLNPSVANETKDDQTIKVLMHFAKSWGFGSMVMTNLFGFITTDPRVLLKAEDPVGFENDQWLMLHARQAGMVVACWSAHGELLGRGDKVARMMTESGIALHCFGLCANGHPRHPLRMNYRTQPTRYGQDPQAGLP